MAHDETNQKVYELEFLLREEVLKCEELRAENDLLRETLERLALNKNVDTSKFNTVRINDVLKSGDRKQHHSEDNDESKVDDDQNTGEDQSDKKDKGNTDISAKYQEQEEIMFTLDNENNNLKEQVEELRNINETAKDELHDAIKSLREAKKLEDDYKVLKSNYNRILQENEERINEQTTVRMEELHCKTQEVETLKSKLEETEVALIDATREKSREKSKILDDNNRFETPSKYQYDLMKIELENTKEVLKEHDKRDTDLRHQNIFEQERLQHENQELQKEVEKIKKNYKGELDSEKERFEDRLKDLTEAFDKKDREKEMLENDLKHLEVRFTEFAGVDSLMDAIRNRNLELEKENDEINTGLKSLWSKISIISSLNDDSKKSSVIGAHDFSNDLNVNGRQIINEQTRKFHDIQNSQQDLNSHIELKDKKITELIHESQKGKEAYNEMEARNYELMGELEIFGEELDNMKNQEDEGFKKLEDLENEKRQLAEENRQMMRIFDPEKIRLLEDKISELQIETKSTEELFDKLIDGYGSGSEVGSTVRLYQNVLIDHNRVKSEIQKNKREMFEDDFIDQDTANYKKRLVELRDALNENTKKEMKLQEKLDGATAKLDETMKAHKSKVDSLQKKDADIERVIFFGLKNR